MADGLNAKAQRRKEGDGVKLRGDGCFTAERGMGYTGVGVFSQQGKRGRLNASSL